LLGAVASITSGHDLFDPWGTRRRSDWRCLDGPCDTEASSAYRRRPTASDEGGRSGVGNHGLISSHRKLLWPNTMVVSVCGNAGTRCQQPWYVSWRQHRGYPRFAGGWWV